MLQNAFPHSSLPLNPPPASLSSTSSTSLSTQLPIVSAPGLDTTPPPLVWDWILEHEDRAKERKADNALRDTPRFEVDRKLLKDVVREKMGVDVGRITFLSAGTFMIDSAFRIAGLSDFFPFFPPLYVPPSVFFSLSQEPFTRSATSSAPFCTVDV